ncbi:MAG: ferrochelatase [bacterium]|nr:ferrochelatase [bacterium]
MTGVLLMAYGSPSGPEDLEVFYTSVRGGRPPLPEMLRGLGERYRAIGGRSPLPEITRRQAAALQACLDVDAPGRFRVYAGMRHSPPFIAEAVAAMADDGITAGVGLALVPHYSRLGVGAYIAAAEAARESTPALSLRYVERWGNHPRFLDAVASRLGDALTTLSQEERGTARVVFTAHSLPKQALADGDPYTEELHRTCQGVADRSGVREWILAYQSAGRTAGPWLEPNVHEVILGFAGSGAQAVVVCPVGFISDHLEVLYDIDIECRALAASAGLRMVRAASLNDCPLLIEALADLAREAAASFSMEQPVQ